MKKFLQILPVFVVVFILFYSLYARNIRNTPGGSAGPDDNTVQQSNSDTNSSNGDTPQPGTDEANTNPDNTAETIQKGLSSAELQIIKPNESGKIMVVMFHNFIESYKKGDKEYTTTFSDFRKLLQTLYDKGYRLISLSDYLNDNISVPAGYIPMVFTFDDGTAGQFNLVEENGSLSVNRESAVGIMEEFNSTHPDFGLEGTFYVNLGVKTFDGKGTVAERLGYLIDKGFEIGNHTLTHVNLKEISSADKIQEEIGGNQKRMYEIIPGYKMVTFSLPFGQPSEDLLEYVRCGEFEGIEYKNEAIMEVGWDPAPSPAAEKFDPMSVHRVRASGIVPVDADLGWWLGKLTRDEQYISDGNPETISVPKSKEELIDKEKIEDKQLIIY